MKQIFLSLFISLIFYPALSQQSPEGLFINSKAPDFRAKDQTGMEIHLKDVLKKGKVVLIFYRGQWCPYCNRQLKKLEDSLQQIISKGATLIAVTPEKPESITKTIEKTNATYSILFDDGLKIMNAYHVAFEVPENTLTQYRNTGIDIEKNNGTNHCDGIEEWKERKA